MRQLFDVMETKFPITSKTLRGDRTASDKKHVAYCDPPQAANLAGGILYVIGGKVVKEERINLEIWAESIQKEEKNHLLENCSSESSFVKLIFPEDGELKKQLERLEEADTEPLLVISSDQRILDLAAEKNVTAIGYQPPHSGSFLKADMVVEGFDEINPGFFLRTYERHFHIPWTITETKRCIIREFSMQDLDALYDMYQEAGMTDYMEALYCYEEEREYQKAYIENMYRFYGYGMWLVFEKETGELVGRAGIEHSEKLEGEYELGYAVRTKYQGQGYAFEVCQAIIAYAAMELEIPKLHCMIQKENTKSIKLAEKLGFSFEKELLDEEKTTFDFVKILTSR